LQSIFTNKLVAAFDQKIKNSNCLFGWRTHLEAEVGFYTRDWAFTSACEEIFYRGGRICRSFTSEFLDPALMLHENAFKK